jgi:N-methylhydantoinase A
MTTTAEQPHTNTQSLSVDVGGTFTDVVSVDLATGNLLVGKSVTTASAPAQGIIAALDAIGTDLANAGRFFHGTTLAVNTLLERRGARVGLLVTDGFRDVLEIGRASWPPYRLVWAAPKPLVERRLCRGVAGRVLRDGTVLEELDIEEIVREGQALITEGVEAIAVCFINSYSQPGHERTAAAALAAGGISVPIVLSHEISRRAGEFERAVTTAGEASLRPKMRKYFEALRDGSEAGGFHGRLFMTSSDAGVMGIEQAASRTLRTLVSGCASGVAGAAALGRAHGWANMIAIDMGGTSFEAAVVRDGYPAMRATSVVDELEFQIPMVELATIGAGGGSIAWVDDGGGLQVGPRSAGAEPGPACYGLGGEEATFTDAALVTGLLSDELLGGGLRLHRENALGAIERTVAGPLGLAPLEAASGIVTVIEAKMARTIEAITIGKGVDPRDFVLFAYGGGGPLVAAPLADELSIPTVVVPPHAGVFSALGMQSLDIVHDLSVTCVQPLPPDGAEFTLPQFSDLLDGARRVLEGEGVGAGDRLALASVEMRHQEQEHTLTVELGAPTEPIETDVLRRRFAELHELAYGFMIEGPLEIVGCRVRAIGILPKPRVWGGSDNGAGKAAPPTPTAHRTVSHWTSRVKEERWPVFDRSSLRSGEPIEGPAILSELTTTTLVPPRWNVVCDRDGNLILSSARARSLG